MSGEDDAAIKRMADLLRRGATMLAQACPTCGAPLLKLGDEIYCASCDKVISPQQESQEQVVQIKVSQLWEAIIQKLNQLGELMSELTRPTELEPVVHLILQLLTALDLIIKISKGE